MSKSHDDCPTDLREIDARLRARRCEWTAMELDAIKVRAMASGTKGVSMRPTQIGRRVVALAAAASISVGGLAIAHSFTPKPGQGCGDRHHYHEKSGKCKPNKKNGHRHINDSKVPNQQHARWS